MLVCIALSGETLQRQLRAFAVLSGILPTRGSLLIDIARQLVPQQMMKQVVAAGEQREVPEVSVSLRN